MFGSVTWRSLATYPAIIKPTICTPDDAAPSRVVWRVVNPMPCTETLQYNSAPGRATRQTLITIVEKFMRILRLLSKSTFRLVKGLWIDGLPIGHLRCN